MRVLERMGFVTIHKRIKRIATPFGPRVVQESNAYKFNLPTKGLGALAMAVFCPPSLESTKSSAIRTSYTTADKTNGDRATGEAVKGNSMKEDRWWLHEPVPTSNGGWR
jgi:hypothetical protein